MDRSLRVSEIRYKFISICCTRWYTMVTTCTLHYHFRSSFDCQTCNTDVEKRINPSFFLCMYIMVFVFSIFCFLFGSHRQADAVSKSKRQRAPNEETKLNETATILMNCFRIFNGDRSNSLETSKRWGTLYIVNSLFKVYFEVQ
jgi:hypothetical protein